MQKHVETRLRAVGLLSILLSLMLLLGFRLSTGPGVAAIEFPLIPIGFMVLFVVGFVLAVASVVQRTLRRRLVAGLLAYALVGIISLPILALKDVADGSLTLDALLREVTDIRFYVGLIVLWPIWPLLLVDVLGIFAIFHRL